MRRKVARRWIRTPVALCALSVTVALVSTILIVGDRGRGRMWTGTLERKHGDFSGAIQTFQDMGPEALPILEKLLDTEPSFVRDFYAGSYEKMPLRVQELLPEPSLDAVAIRARAIDVLGKLGEDAKPAIPLLIKAATDSEAPIRMAAVIALGNLHRLASPDTALVLSAALFDPNPFVRENACHALGRIGADASDAIPVLSRFVTGVDSNMKLLAIGALGTMGPAARPAMPLLLEVSRTGSETERVIALRAIAEINGPPPRDDHKSSHSMDN